MSDPTRDSMKYFDLFSGVGTRVGLVEGFVKIKELLRHCPEGPLTFLRPALTLPFCFVRQEALPN